MINLTFKEKTPPIDRFPNDDIFRVVWAYGSVQKGLTVTGVPEIHILLVDLFFNTLKNEFQLSNKTRVVKISIAQLDIVRYMTIWKGQKRINGCWENFSDYKSNVRFDLDTTNSESLNYSKQNQNKTYSYLFPFNKYKIENIDKQYFVKFTNSTFTKISHDNIDVIIPSMELFTSTYAPHEQQIRYKLIQKSLSDTLDDYVKSSTEDSGKYIINIVFLAYASLNQITRQRLSKTRASLENGMVDKYPVILPYHPTSLSIQGDGFWINENTFFMLRINKYSLPDDYEIVLIKEELDIEESKKENDKNKSYGQIPRNLDDYQLPATNEHNPHRRNGYLSLISEVDLLDDVKYKISRKVNIKTIKAEEKNREIQNTYDIKNVSSGEADSTKDSEKTAKLCIKEENKKLHQSKALDSFLNDILQMRDTKTDISEGNKIYISNIHFLNEEANFVPIKYFIQFNDILRARGEKNSFARMINRIEEKDKSGKTKRKNFFFGYRRCFLLKICLSNGKWFYLLEIERKDNVEGFSGLLLKPLNEFDKAILEENIMTVIKAKGILKNATFKIKNVIFKHAVDKKSGSLIDCYSKNFRKILK
jgi:hypothetical protein